MANRSDVPDSWDDGDQQSGDSGKNSMEAAFAKFNINAAEFVPSFLPRPAATSVPAAVPAPVAAPVATPPTVASSTAPAADSAPKPVPTEPPAPKPKKEKPAEKPKPTPAPAPQKDEAMDVEEEAQSTPAPKPIISLGPRKEHLNIVFIGHVDAGKSTIGGHLLLLTGAVDKRTMEKYEKEAKEAGRESWWLSWALDVNPEERDKGKTVEVGRAGFETESKLYTILDAPGHKSFVNNMVEGAAQADVAILVISARKGEFETGFDRGGQTREHAMLAKSSNVKYLVVVVNKMDEPTVNWSQERYDEIKGKLGPHLKNLGFKDSLMHWMPISGYSGANLRDRVDKKVCPWYDGPSFLEYLDNLPAFPRSGEGPVRMPILGKFKDMGTVVVGKLESGQFRRGDSLVLMPNKTAVEVMQLWADDNEVEGVINGDNVRAKLKGVEEEDVQPGFVLCDPGNPCKSGSVFDAQVAIFEHKNIVTAGYKAMMHLHMLAEPVSVELLIFLVDKKTQEKTQKFPKYIKPGQVGIMRMKCEHGVICMETYKNFPQLGRFVLRDEGRTIGMGNILKVVQ